MVEACPDLYYYVFCGSGLNFTHILLKGQTRAKFSLQYYSCNLYTWKGGHRAYQMAAKTGTMSCG